MHAANPTLSSSSQPGLEPLKNRANARLNHRQIVTITLLATLTFAGSFSKATTVSDGFEGFTNTSGSTVTGYNGWTGSPSASAVVNNDGTAYQGSYYLRLLDTTPSTVSATKSFSSTPVYADGAAISFALRIDPDGSGFTNDQVVVNGAPGSGDAALQCGIKGEGTNAEFSYSPVTGGTATSTVALTSYGTVTANTWYVFNIVYSTGGTLAGTYSLSITNASTTSIVYSSTTPLAGQSAFASLAAENLSSALSETTSLYKGSADLDSLSLSNAASDPAPEPASIAGLTLLSVGQLLRRRRRVIGPMPDFH